VTVQCEFAVNTFEFFQDATGLLLGIPPILDGIEACDFIGSRHGTQKKTVASAARMESETFLGALEKKIAACERRRAERTHADRTTH
jgi:hypothetical protein